MGVMFLNSEEINEISQNLIKLLVESDKRKLENEKYKSEEDVEEEEIELLNEEKEGTKVTIGGIIESSRRIFTKKNNNEMAFLVIGNEKGLSIECVVFPRIFEQHKSLLIRDQVIIIEGHLDTKNDRPTIIADKISSVRS